MPCPFRNICFAHSQSIFESMERMGGVVAMEEYGLSQATLEQIFNQFAAMQVCICPRSGYDYTIRVLGPVCGHANARARVSCLGVAAIRTNQPNIRLLCESSVSPSQACHHTCTG